MLVKELIEELQKLNPEARVVVRGYEGGRKDVENYEEVYLELNVNNSWYYGNHEETLEHKNNPAVLLG